ncbi:MAG: SHOCT domain-containing protein [Actinomycetota bacterium]|nr:SHOCT domain-containing protein [Rubrobacteraceae bacterium]MDQ3301756.1 SHOCT domain-containing protein [Actinomycetota bacterium]MDQ3496349.1 SHOCT domain-containing protein [Actinomycetota bacterium]
MMDGMMGGGWVWMLLPLLFWGGLLAFAAWALIRIFPNRSSDSGGSEVQEEGAEEILRKRFARGEIDAEEYERSIKVLNGGINATRGGI